MACTRSALNSLTIVSCAISLVAGGCAKTDGPGDDTARPAGSSYSRPGVATDTSGQRAPNLGGDLSALKSAQVTMADGLAQVEKSSGPTIEAKFEKDDAGKLSLSVYAVPKGLRVDAERSEFQEISGDPTSKPWATKVEGFKAGDFEHLTRSARDLTLVQLSRLTLPQVVSKASQDGLVYWAIPTIERKRAGYGVYTLVGSSPRYRFFDGEGSRDTVAGKLVDLGTGPGAGATDQRRPNLRDLSILSHARISMADALKQTEGTNGPAIEAKFELDDAGKLSLSIYPVAKGILTDPEHNEFQELAGDPAAPSYAPKLEGFKADDVEHITRSSRDLTLVQTARLTLRQAVEGAQAAVPGGVVYWAIPTIRDTRSGYGVYVYGPDKRAHYFFVS